LGFIEILIAILDAIVASCFLVGATFYLMVAYSDRERRSVWTILGTTGMIWFLVTFIKLIANMTGAVWVAGTVRGIVGLSLALYMVGLITLARKLR
jgi:hypothetical protein